MTKEECRAYLDKKIEVKAMAKERCIQALETGTPILIDAVF